MDTPRTFAPAPLTPSHVGDMTRRLADKTSATVSLVHEQTGYTDDSYLQIEAPTAKDAERVARWVERYCERYNVCTRSSAYNRPGSLGGIVKGFEVKLPRAAFERGAKECPGCRGSYTMRHGFREDAVGHVCPEHGEVGAVLRARISSHYIGD